MHTKEPSWKKRIGFVVPGYGDKDPGIMITWGMSFRPCAKHAANIHRIYVCWNALAGIENPKAFVEKGKAALFWRPWMWGERLHDSEPWMFDSEKTIQNVPYPEDDPKHRESLMMCSGTGSDSEHKRNVQRICECVNALAGIADPEDFVARAKVAFRSRRLEHQRKQEGKGK